MEKIKTFGPERWGPSIDPEDGVEHVKTPEGTPCFHCEELIGEQDYGIYYANGPISHRECFIYQIFGHQAGYCHCKRENLTDRERGRLTWKWVQEHNAVD